MVGGWTAGSVRSSADYVENVWFPSKHLHTLPDTDQKNLDAVNRHRRFGWVSQIPR